MKIQDQVCTLGQAKKLKELGVNQAGSYFAYQGNVDYEPDLKSDDSNSYAAFTVAELGEMLPAESGMKFFSSYYNDHLGDWFCEFSGFKTDEEHEAWDWSANPPPKIHETEEETEAQARAAMLIYLLENNLITSEEVNNRLSN